MREINIFRYFPSIIQNFREFQEISASETPEFKQLSVEMNDRLADAFIQEATLDGIKHYEKMLGLTCRAGDTLEYRRARALQKMAAVLPFTFHFLVKKLEDLFGDAYDLLIDPSACTISVKVTSDRYRAMDLLHDLLWDILPAHLAVSASQEVTNCAVAEVYVSGFLSGVCIQTVPPELSYHIRGEIPVAVFTSNTIIQSIGG